MTLKMMIEYPRNVISELVVKQLQNIFLFDVATELDALNYCLDDALVRSSTCFGATDSKYYQKNGDTYFNPFHTGQYSIFLYFVSRSVFLTFGEERRSLADRIYYLNKCLNCLDIYYEVEMPDIFFLDHPVGSVMGRASYGNRFRFSQNCTVGNNNGIYPKIGENVTMMSGSKILGNCVIGDNVIISACTYVKDSDVPSCSVVYGMSPNLVYKNRPLDYFT